MSIKFLPTLINEGHMFNLKQLRQIFEKKALKIEKRFRLVIAVLILGLVMFLSTFFYFDKAVFFLPVFFIITYLLTYFSLLEKIEKISWYSLFFMPVVLTIFFYLFYFLVPGRWLTRIPFIIFYIISLYAMLLCSNIFNVGVEKSLQLYRAAFSINFFYQAFISFLYFNILFSLKKSFLINTVGVGIVGFLFGLHLFWTIKLDKHLGKQIITYALLVGLILSEMGLLISFIPFKTTISGLFLTTSYYSLSGIIYSYLDQKLFKETVREYVSVFIFVMIITLLSLSW
jgi:hypothetical protein